jgi:DNA-directed RNA polymerase subunit H (RpoH/RPB5)
MYNIIVTNMAQTSAQQASAQPAPASASAQQSSSASTQSSQIIEIYHSRKHMIDLLEAQHYDVSQYKDFGINDVNTLYQTKQMDMLLTNASSGKKAYIKYHLAKSLRPVNLYEYIEDLFTLDEVLKKKDDLIVIMKDEPNDTIRKTLTNIWEQDGIFVVVINIKRLQYNIMQHQLVPPHTVLSSDEANEIKTRYNITDDAQIPDISRFSPVSQLIGIRPGEICRIMRPSKTAIRAEFYRICTNK